MQYCRGTPVWVPFSLTTIFSASDQGTHTGVPLQIGITLLFQALEVAAHFLVDFAYVRGVPAN